MEWMANMPRFLTNQLFFLNWMAIYVLILLAAEEWISPRGFI